MGDEVSPDMDASSATGALEHGDLRRRRGSDPIAAAGRQRSLLIRIFRLGYIVLIVTVTLLYVIDIGAMRSDRSEEPSFLATNWWLTVMGTVVLAGVFLAVDVLTPNKKLQSLGAVILGLIAGLVGAVAAGFIVDLVASSWDIPDARFIAVAKILIGISLCYLGVSVVLQTQDDFRLVIPYVEFAKQIRGPRPMLVDSSALIDARIADIGETGIIQSPLVVPAFVVSELQHLADSSDKLARAKGRRGLEVVGRLQRSAWIDVSIDETPVPGKAVDQMLVEFARRMPAMLLTSDVALARIAGFQQIPVVNVNDLANAMKPAFVPGETLRLRLARRGEQEGQAVGYLDDGTMVIAENGARSIGETVDLTVRTTLQTQAGRLVFARLPETSSESAVEEDDADDASAGGPQAAGDAPERSAGGAAAAGVSDGPFPAKQPKQNPGRNPRRSPSSR